MAEEIERARARLEERWASDGDCRSCGFHGSLEEYDVQDLDIEHALRHCSGWLHLTCRSSADDTDDHRGVKVYLGD